MPNSTRVRSAVDGEVERRLRDADAGGAIPTRPAASDASAAPRPLPGCAEDVVGGDEDVLEDDVGGDLAAVAHLAGRARRR